MRQLLCLILVVSNAWALFAQSERVLSFHSAIVVDTSSSITVKESIKIYATGTIFKRGITRTIPTRSVDSSGNSVKHNFKILAVEKDGRPSKYHTKSGSGSTTIYVGEKDVFLSEGEYNYSITYRMSGQIRFFKDYDELYWNVNGFDWALAFGEVSCDITLPASGTIIQKACYTGRYGSSNTNCSTTPLSEHQIRFSAGQLNAGENLTVAVGFSKGSVTQPPPPPPPTFLQKFGALILSAFISLALLFYYGYTWLRFGIDPPKPTVIPQFEIPNNMSPASIGMLDKLRYDGDLITGTIINLAVKGLLKIEEKTQDYVFGLFKNKTFNIHKLKESTGTLNDEEEVLFSKLFADTDQLKLDGKYDADIQSAVMAYRSSLKKQHQSFIYEGFNFKFWILPFFTIVAYIVAFVFLASKYFEGENDGLIFAVFLVLNIIFFLIYQYLIRKPTIKKLKLRALIEGFKMYMSGAEEKQIAHFNPPDLTPEIFEQLLPYAIVLGAEDVWGDKFQKLINTAMVDQSYQPTWYAGRVTNFSSFNHSLNSSLSNSFSRSATPPSSRGSGSGGGGFSGGGGGGGGGGGW
ncbi:DUF2207 domain-containing protein [Winogradskyella alexanderae]|uniref:DUF2207 domain-containing protein n=1 Tax=Winogradskyella alexanderae TaxID=2877123 RepID=A0ABS7XV36_9FLAO|nr:DUF2207 domain-containing protein [Winogradskyella alexanderae]MCA0133873.1 DUF2207 domain-containing protein [Winogradskyella alexanderae]